MIPREGLKISLTSPNSEIIPGVNDRDKYVWVSSYYGLVRIDLQNYSYNINTTPTLLVWGAKDGIVPIHVGEALHTNFAATTTLITFKKAKHDAHFRYFRKVNREVINFLNN